MNNLVVQVKVQLCGEHLAALQTLEPITPDHRVDGILVLPQLAWVARLEITLIADLVLDFFVDGFDVKFKCALIRKAPVAFITSMVSWYLVITSKESWYLVVYQFHMSLDIGGFTTCVSTFTTFDHSALLAPYALVNVPSVHP